MKRITSSVGLVALGAVSLQAAYDSGLSPLESTKPWSVSAAVRGFYDDNYTAAHSSFAEETFGVQISPSVAFRAIRDQSVFRVSYDGSAKFYEESEDWDLSHVFKASLDHRFSERYRLKLANTFSIIQEPDVTNGGIPLRSEGDNIHNRASISFHGALTEVAGYEIAYQNDYFNYDSLQRSQQLDRMEHDVLGRLTWSVQEETVLSVGGKYRYIDYASVASNAGRSNARIYYGFGGIDHEFNSKLTGSARAGFYYTDPSLAGADSSLDPYVDISLTYAYAEAGYVQLGFKNDRTQSDLNIIGQNTSGVYVNWRHALTDKIGFTGTGVLQNSEFDGGGLNGEDELFGQISGALDYAITENFSAEAGYIYTRLNSDASQNRSYSRNRVYLGVRASF